MRIERLSMSTFTELQEQIFNLPERGELSDGYHSFNELYYHRMILFSIICNQNKAISWKSKHHEDGTMFENYFVVGINTPDGQFTYHYHMDHWDKFNDVELKRDDLVCVEWAKNYYLTVDLNNTHPNTYPFEPED